MTDLLIRWLVKDYQNTASSRVRVRYGKVASIVGIAGNLLLFLIKIVVGMLFGSIAIVADAVNNLSDSGSSLIALVGFKISGKPPDEKHPYGHARMEYISGLIVSFIVIVLGVRLIESSVTKIITPQVTRFSLISIVVLVVSILIKLWLAGFFQNIGKIIDSTTLIATSADSKNDVLTTLAVLLATITTYLTGFNLDGYMGALVALFIIITGIKLVIETTNPLLGTAPSKELVDSIYAKILSYDGIIGLHDLAVHSYGPGQCFASVHCEVSADQDIMESHDIIDTIENDFLNNDDIKLVIHLDPIVISDEKTNELRALVHSLVQQISPELGMHDFRAVWGKTHSNLIFDVVVPFDFERTDDELTRLISEKIHKINPTYYAVIRVDHDYVPS